MTKLKELSKEDQAIVTAFKIGLEAYDQNDKMMMKHLEIREQHLKTMLDFKYDSEPLKLFKKTHKKWEEEVDKLETELYNVYQEMGKVFEERQAFFERLKKA